MRFAVVMFLLAAPNLASATAYPSVACVFTEPFVSVAVWPGGASLIEPERTTAATTRTLGGTAGTPVISAIFGGTPMTLAVTEDPGSDGMSDHDYPWRGELNGYRSPNHSGGCLRYPDGTTPRPVTGVAPQRRLAVRALASPNARVVGKLGFRSHFWAFPEPAVRGWVRGAFEKMPVEETGQVTFAEGWVHARHLGRPGSR
jgi:uncharacterized membrane protein